MTGPRQIRLDPDRLGDKESMALFLKQHIALPEWFRGNLDALADALSEVTDEVVFEVDAGMLDRFGSQDRAAKTLQVISEAAGQNPHLHLYLMQ